MKLPLYARCGVPEVRIVNLDQWQIEIYCVPNGTLYQVASAASREEAITAHLLPEVPLSVSGILV